MTTQTTFNPKCPPPLNSRETNLLRTLQTHLRLEGQSEFTVDTLRMLGFDRFMPKDKRGNVNYGTMLLKWHVFGYIERTGRSVCSTLESNHARREQVWKMRKQP